MIRISPTFRMSIGLMFISITVLLFANLIGLVPDRSKADMEARKMIVESLAVQSTASAREGNIASIRTTLDGIASLHDDILSMGLIRSDGSYIAQTMDHKINWVAPPGGSSTYTHWQVPIYQGSKEWATLEIVFSPKQKGFSVLGYHFSPLTLLIIWCALISFAGFLLFIRRSFRYLDPSSVLPSRVKYALDTLSEGLLILDTQGRIVLANSAFTDKMGLNIKDLIGMNASQLNWINHDEKRPIMELPWIKAQSSAETQLGSFLSINTKDHGVRSFVVNGAPILDDKGTCRGVVATFDDITELEKKNYQLSEMLDLLQESRYKLELKNQELEVLATQDPLTGCLNRRTFFPTVQQLMEEAKAQGRNIACIMTDIDLFKSINDRFGHAVGDQVIIFFAKSLQSVLREGDLICRYGGEEFCIMLKNCDMDKATAIAERVRRKIAEQGALAIPETAGIVISASFGISDLTIGSQTAEDLFAQADRALYQAKEEGRNRVIVWDNDKESKYLQKEAIQL